MVVKSRSVKRKCEKRAGAGERQGGGDCTHFFNGLFRYISGVVIGLSTKMANANRACDLDESALSCALDECPPATWLAVKIMSTGFGKSLIFQLFPHLAKAAPYEGISMTKFNNLKVKRVKSNLKYTESKLVKEGPR